MGIKIRGLFFSNAKVARKSIMRLTNMSIPDEAKLLNANLIKQLAISHSKKAKDFKERRDYREAARIYAIFIDILKSDMKK